MKLRPREYLFLAVISVLLVCGGYSLWAMEIVGSPPPIRLQTTTQQSFVFAAADTTKTATLGAEFYNSEIHSVKVVIPTFSAVNPTATFSIKDPAGATLYSIAALAESSTNEILLSRPLTYGSSYTILLTTTAGTGGGTATVDTWVYK